MISIVTLRRFLDQVLVEGVVKGKENVEEIKGEFCVFPVLREYLHKPLIQIKDKRVAK